MMLISACGYLTEPIHFVTVTFVHKKRCRWPKWMEMCGGLWRGFQQSSPDKTTTIRTYDLSWNAN